MATSADEKNYADEKPAADNAHVVTEGAYADDSITPPPPAYGDPYDSDTPAAPSTPPRRTSESSTERSLYDDVDAKGRPASTAATALPSATSPASAKTLHFYGEGALHRNLSVCRKNDAGQSVAAWYAEMSEFQPNKPDVLLHEGADAHGAVQAAARFRWSRTVHVCLGDPHGQGKHQWEELGTKSILHHGKYEMRISRPQGVLHLVWERTHDETDGVGGAAKASFQNYRVIDANFGTIVAVYLRNRLKSWKKHGKLVFHAPVDSELERWIIIGCAALAEKARRRAARRTAAAGGGSGSGGGGS